MTIIEKYAKERKKNKNKKLLLLGTAVTCFEIDYDDYDDIWAAGSAFGECYTDIKRIDLGFEIHPMDQMVIIAKERNVNFNKYKCPIFVQDEKHPIAMQMIEKPVTFPLDDMLQYIEEINASVCMTSSFCYMIVWAALMGYKDVLLYKILLTSDLEYYLERPGLEYWIDRLGHVEDIDFSFPEDAEMWTNKILYGYEQRPNLWKMQSRKKYLWDVFSKHFSDIEILSSLLSRLTGMIEMFNIINTNARTIHELELKLKNEQVIEKRKELEKQLADNKMKIPMIIQDCREKIQINQDKYIKSRDKYMQFSGAIQTQQFLEERQY